MTDWTIDKIKKFNEKIDLFVKEEVPKNSIFTIQRGEYLFDIKNILKVSIYRGNVTRNGIITVSIFWRENNARSLDRASSSTDISENEWGVMENYLISLIKETYESCLPLIKLDILKYKFKDIRDLKLTSILHENQK